MLILSVLFKIPDEKYTEDIETSTIENIIYHVTHKYAESVFVCQAILILRNRIRQLKRDRPFYDH
jgi:hypothetical protein